MRQRRRKTSVLVSQSCHVGHVIVPVVVGAAAGTPEKMGRAVKQLCPFVQRWRCSHPGLPRRDRPLIKSRALAARNSVRVCVDLAHALFIRAAMLFLPLGAADKASQEAIMAGGAVQSQLSPLTQLNGRREE